MKEFMMAALPWVIAGLCVAVLAVRAGRKESKEQETYMGEGMCLGMCLGVSLDSLIGSDNLGIVMCIGMLIGEVIGMMIPKKKDT
ncbi:hypothetical protein [Frisingicoccus sp.]|uniref:hypothetical protein n=1 Tax=Frisingicoccus sp. TaxID=1918627 RepID=UPI003AB2596C